MALIPPNRFVDSSQMQGAAPTATWPRLRAWLGSPPVTELHDETLGVECALPWVTQPAALDDGLPL